MRLSEWTLIFPSQKSHSDRLLVNIPKNIVYKIQMAFNDSYSKK